MTYEDKNNKGKADVNIKKKKTKLNNNLFN